MMRGLVVAAMVALCAVSAPAQTAAKGKAKSAARSAVPRTADGKPDLTGVWQGNSRQRGNWDEANAGLGVGGTGRDPSAAVNPSSSVPPPGSELAPYQPWAAAKVVEAFNRRGIDDPATFCLPPGLPRATNVSLFPLQIIQTSRQVVILYEYMSLFRLIPLNAKHPDDFLPSYMGNSVGRWEGDTLVVDVIGFNDKTWLAGTETFHSDALHIVERYTRVDKDQINYDVTMEDPQVLTNPWTLHSTIMLREGTRLEEYVCAENNLDPGHFEKLQKEGVSFTR